MSTTDDDKPRDRRDHIRGALRPLRNAKGWSLEAAARHTGIAAVVLGSWERQDRMPPIPTLIDLFAMYGATLAVVRADERVVSSVVGGRERVVFVVVSPDGIQVERDTVDDADALARVMPGSKVGYRVDRVGVVEFGRPNGGAW